MESLPDALQDGGHLLGQAYRCPFLLSFSFQPQLVVSKSFSVLNDSLVCLRPVPLAHWKHRVHPRCRGFQKGPAAVFL